MCNIFGRMALTCIDPLLPTPLLCSAVSSPHGSRCRTSSLQACRCADTRGEKPPDRTHSRASCLLSYRDHRQKAVIGREKQRPYQSVTQMRLKPRPLTFRANEAPADVDVFVITAALPWREVVGTDDAVSGQDDAAGRDAVIASVVRDGASNAVDQSTCAGAECRRVISTSVI